MRLSTVAIPVILTILVTGGAVVLATTDHARVEGVVPMPVHGDFAAYDTLDGRFAFRWAGTALMQRATGETREFEILEADGAEGPRRLAFAGARLEIIESVHEITNWHNASFVVSEHRRTVAHAERVLDYAPEDTLLHCLARAGWQGRSLASLDGADAASLCPVLDGRLERTADGDLDGIPLARFTGAFYLGAPASLEFAPGLAYPVMIGSADDHFAIVAHIPGEGAKVATTGPIDEAAPPTFPVGASGPSVGSTFSFFTIDDALAKLDADAALVGYGMWRRDHPDTQVESAMLWPNGSPCGPSYWWHLKLRGSDDTAVRMSVRETSGCKSADVSEVTDKLPIIHDSLTGFMVAEGVGAVIIPSTGISFDHAYETFILGALADTLRVTSLAFTAGGSDGDGPARAVIDVEGFGDVADEFARESASFDLETGKLLERRVKTIRFDTDLILDLTGWEDGIDLGPESGTRTVVLGAGLVTIRGMGWAVSGVAVTTLVASIILLHLGKFVAALYTRLNGSDISNHPRRERILAHVRAHPGASHQDIENNVDGGTGGGLVYHLKRLVTAGLLVRVRSGRFVRYFPEGHATALDIQRVAVERDDTSEGRAFAIVRETPGIHAAEVARRIDLTRPTTLNLIRRLESRGLVEIRREGGRLGIYAM